ncbi:Glycosyltransferase involved in cell wall bisynthesis [Ekhidna lutea]|uniref:Glycosyltransferase involved in cell wall bisynthesis n=1 Tax=Ekhidna lutea TaxID=447679 RepID=A0A239FPY9_EKHLU|nr:glycosyltransferase family 4 protein [Ekhidna lutea]SNS58997.1 Glycosyltransferase involved in cell wall bisynthesis [Ekhidna lutea]
MLLHQYAKCWAEEHDITVIRPHSYNLLTANKLRKKKLKACFEIDGINVFNVPVLRLPGDNLQIKKFRKIISELGKFDFILGSLPVGIEITHYVSSTLGIPYFTYLHNTDFHRSGLSKGRLTSRYKMFLMKADGIGYISTKLQKAFERTIMESSKGILLPGAISPSWLTEPPKRSFKSPMKLVAPARLVKQKNIDLILKAFSKLLSLDYQLTIAGDGEQREFLEHLVASDLNLKAKVSFIGMVDHEVLKKLFDQSDFMILMSTNESFGLVYLEAMARGCIPIGTRGEGIDGVIQHGENGFLCDPDPESISQQLSEISKLPSASLLKVSTNASETAKNFVYDKLAKFFIDFAKTKLRHP